MTAFSPDTWTTLQALQWTIFTECKVATVTPFSPFSTADLATYGNNPNGSVTSAIYIGVPVEPNTDYDFQCWITPTDEEVKWRTQGGEVFDTSMVYISVWALLKTGQYTAFQTLTKIRDAMHTVIARHAEQPNAPTINDARWGPSGNGHSNAFFFSDLIGRTWLCWGTTRSMRQQWNAQGGVQP